MVGFRRIRFGIETEESVPVWILVFESELDESWLARKAENGISNYRCHGNADYTFSNVNFSLGKDDGRWIYSGENYKYA